MIFKDGVVVSEGPLTAKSVIDYIYSSGHLPEVYNQSNSLTEYFHNAIVFDISAVSLMKMVRTGGKKFQFALYIAKGCDQAFSSLEDGFYLITIGDEVLCRFALIASRLLPVIASIDGVGKNEVVVEDDYLTELLFKISTTNISELESIFQTWKSNKDYPEKGEHIVFYDQVRLIILHELSHCIFGHLELYNENLGFARLYESRVLCNIDVEDKNRRLLQSMECQADWHAVVALTNQIFYGKTDTALSLFPDGGFDLFPRLAIFNLSLAIFSVYWRVKEEQQGAGPVSDIRELTALPPGSYPPANVRYMNMSETMYQMLIELGAKDGFDKNVKFPENDTENIVLSMMRGAHIGEPCFSLIIRYIATSLFHNLFRASPAASYILGLQTPARFLKRTERPLQSYNQLTLSDYYSIRVHEMSNAYVSFEEASPFMDETDYPSLIIRGGEDPVTSIKEAFGFSKLKKIYGDNWNDVEPTIFPHFEFKA